MRLHLGFIIISSAKRIRLILERKPAEPFNERQKEVWNQLFGIYQTRIFGIVIYRNMTNDDNARKRILNQWDNPFKKQQK